MTSTHKIGASTQASPAAAATSETSSDETSQLLRWGGAAGLAGAALLVGSAVVVFGAGLPDASDAETLTDFANIESGRIAEHFLYLGALMGFALHVFVVHRLLHRTHRAAALFGIVFSAFGLLIMAASSLLHVSTSPLAELYTDPDTAPQDLAAIEYAWHGAQSVFDTMLATGVLLVPIGMALFAVAMRNSTDFGPGLSGLTAALAIVGTVGAAIEVAVPGSDFSAAAVLAIAIFSGVVGWRMFTLGDSRTIDLSTPVA